MNMASLPMCSRLWPSDPGLHEGVAAAVGETVDSFDRVAGKGYVTGEGVTPASVGSNGGIPVTAQRPEALAVPCPFALPPRPTLLRSSLLVKRTSPQP